MNEYEKSLFKKIKNKEDLDYDDLQYLERVLYMTSVWGHVLNVQLGLAENDIGLENVDKRIRG